MICSQSSLSRLLLAATFALGQVSCSSSSTPAGLGAGSEKGPCYGNGTCNPGLACRSELCVSESDAGNAAGGKAGTGGSSSVAGGANANGGATSATDGGIHVTWTLASSTGASSSCTQFPGQMGVTLTATRTGSTTPVQQTFTCSDGAGDVLHLSPGTYTVSLALVDSGGLALAQSPGTTTVVALANCSRTVSGNCVTDVAITITAN
jgi:hypothetical protein